MRRGPLALTLLLSLSILFLACGPARAEVISVPFQGTGLFASSEPTQTFLWEAKHAKAVLIMIPGGEGRIGLTPGRAELGGFYGKVLRPLSDPAKTSGSLHVVVFDSPFPLSKGDAYPTSRGTKDHQERIASAVRFYKERFGLPVWLMGHSNGAISVAEFLWNRSGEVAGAILSSSRVGARLSSSAALPILFLHHKKDICPKADPRDTVVTFETLRAAGKAATAFVWIEGGSAESETPCASGHHMFFGAEAEAYGAIDAFVTTH